MFLWLCVLSIFLPGSPFDPMGYAREWTFDSWLTKFYTSLYIAPALEAGADSNSTTHAATAILVSEPSLISFWNSFTLNGKMSSIFIFFCGITFARLGLWMADLSITQLMQEGIPEEERNTIFGIQNGLCQFFSGRYYLQMSLIQSYSRSMLDSRPVPGWDQGNGVGRVYQSRDGTSMLGPGDFGPVNYFVELCKFSFFYQNFSRISKIPDKNFQGIFIPRICS